MFKWRLCLRHERSLASISRQTAILVTNGAVPTIRAHGITKFTAGKKHVHGVLRRYVADGDGPQEVNGSFILHIHRRRTEPATAVRRLVDVPGPRSKG
jgi:hypothetical protein